MVFILSILLFMALVTVAGAHSVLDVRTISPAELSVNNGMDTSNVVTAGAYKMVANVKHTGLSTGVTFYRTCHNVTMTTANAGKAVAHGGAVVASGAVSTVGSIGHGIGTGTMTITKGIGSIVLFSLRTPGRILGAITSGHAVAAAIRPADHSSVPIIDGETSDAVLAKLSAVERDQITSLHNAQITANRGLDGSIVAGDPNHGGYPARWDNRPQDSTIDSWGMYNRECVSYTAWKVYQAYGYMPYWGGVGNANQWIRDARNGGITTSSVPRAKSVAISLHGYYGHAMWVERVSGDMIYVSQYNYDLRGHYSEMWVNASSFTYLYFK